MTVELSSAALTIAGMNGFGTARYRPLPVGYLGAGWIESNDGENQVIRALSDAGIGPAYSGAAPSLDCRQQFGAGPYTLDFAWPKLKIALEADGSVHRRSEGTAQHDRVRDRWLREQGWLVFRVDTGGATARVNAQVRRVVQVVRALARG